MTKISILIELAQKGNPKAQNDLGYYYQHEEKNYTEAIYWYKKAAEQKNSEALYNLGWCYENGIGVYPNYKKAVRYYEKSTLEEPYAQFKLGLYYTELNDNKRALFWYEIAADNGLSEAIGAVKHGCVRENCFAEDNLKALKWNYKASFDTIYIDQANANIRNIILRIGKNITLEYCNTFYAMFSGDNSKKFQNIKTQEFKSLIEFIRDIYLNSNPELDSRNMQLILNQVSEYFYASRNKEWLVKVMCEVEVDKNKIVNNQNSYYESLKQYIRNCIYIREMITISVPPEVTTIIADMFIEDLLQSKPQVGSKEHEAKDLFTTRLITPGNSKSTDLGRFC